MSYFSFICNSHHSGEGLQTGAVESSMFISVQNIKVKVSNEGLNRMEVRKARRVSVETLDIFTAGRRKDRPWKD